MKKFKFQNYINVFMINSQLLVKYIIYFLLVDNLNGQCDIKITNCPNVIEIVDCDNSGDEVLIWPSIISNHNGFCDYSTLTQTSGPLPGSIAPVGQYIVTYEAQGFDSQNNLIDNEICTFTVKVIKDSQPPYILNCPANITVSGLLDNSGKCCAIASWPQPIVIDNCKNYSLISQNINCGSNLCNQINNIIYEYSDQSGNKVQCQFNVTINCTTETNLTSQTKITVNVIPNPNNGYFQLRLNDLPKFEYQLVILDNLGKVKSIQKNITNTKIVDMNLDFLPSGLYFLHILSPNEKIITVKFIKY